MLAGSSAAQLALQQWPSIMPLPANHDHAVTNATVFNMQAE
jgi:hypothetical protein